MGDVWPGSIYKLLYQVLDREGEGLLTDSQLLERFVVSRDEAAFEVLVHRHGRTVWNACRRVLSREHDAEDAFQATFLTLTRKAGSIARRQSVAGWLRNVARRVALKAKAKATSQTNLEQQRAVTEAFDDPTPACVRQEIWLALDEEIERLPRKYRLPFVLCHLEGKTNAEASRELGCPENTIATRLARARQQLARQLSRRGVTLSTGLGATVLLDKPAATMSAQLISATVRAGVAYARGGVHAGIISAEAVTLAEGVVRTMLMTKIGVGVGLVMFVGLLVGGAGFVVSRESAPPTETAKTERIPSTGATGAGEKKTETPQPAKFDRHGDPLPEGALARLGTTRLRSTYISDESSVSFLPSGKTLMLSSPRTGIELWDTDSGKLQRRILQWDPLGKFIPERAFVTASPDGKMAAWSLCNRQSPFPSAELALEGWVLLMDMSSGKEIRRFQAHKQLVYNAVFSQDGKTLITVGVDQAVRVWDVGTAKQLHQATNVQANLRDPVFFSPDRKTLVATGLCVKDRIEDRKLRLWDVETGKLLHAFENEDSVAFSGTIQTVAFSPDSKMLAARCRIAERGNVWWVLRVWDVASGKELRQLKDLKGKIRGKSAVAFSPDNRMLAAAGSDGETGWRVCLWEVATGKELRSWLNDQKKWSWIESLAFSPDSKTLAAKGNFPAIQLWDIATGKSLVQLEGHHGTVDAMAFAPDGKRLATSAGDAVLLWDVATSKLCRQLEASQNCEFLAYSPDCKLLAGSRRDPGKENYTVLLWDVSTGKQIRSLEGLENSRFGFGTSNDVCCLTFAPNGRTLAAGAAERGVSAEEHIKAKVWLWDVATGKLIRSLAVAEPKIHQYCCAVTFSPDSRNLASAIKGMTQIRDTVYIWDVTTGKKLGRYPLNLDSWNFAPAQPWAEPPLSFSPDKKMLASWGRGQTGVVRLWETASGEERLTIRLSKTSHIRHIGRTGFGSRGYTDFRVSFSPDNRLLVTGGDNEAVQLWDIATGRQLHKFPTDQGSIRSLAFAPDGKSLAVGNGDTTVLIWDVTTWIERKNDAIIVSPDELKVSLSALASADAVKAYQALGKLVTSFDQAVPLLAERLFLATVDPQRMTQLLIDLDSDDFQVRSQARKELEKMSVAAEPFLRQALKGKPSVEVYKSVKELLSKIDVAKNEMSPKQRSDRRRPQRRTAEDEIVFQAAKENEKSPWELSLLRSVEALERIGTLAARQALRKVAKTPPNLDIGVEAKAALGRLEARPVHPTVP